MLLEARLELDLRIAAKSQLVALTNIEGRIVAQGQRPLEAGHLPLQLQECVVVPDCRVGSELLWEEVVSHPVEFLQPAVLLGKKAQLLGRTVFLDDEDVVGAGEDEVGRDEDACAGLDEPLGSKDLYEADEAEGLHLHFLLGHFVEFVNGLKKCCLVFVDLTALLSLLLIHLCDGNLLSIFHVRNLMIILLYQHLVYNTFRGHL
jgi:hypothetical protein